MGSSKRQNSKQRQRVSSAAQKPSFETLEARTLFSATDLSILSFGDSITFGIGGGEDQSYRYHLTQALDAAGVSYDMVGALDDGSGYDNDHHGIPGARANSSYWGSTGYRPSLTESLQNGDVLESGQTPNVILLHIGTNSIRDWDSSVDDALGQLEVLLNEMALQWRNGTFADDVTVMLADLIPGARSTDGSKTFSPERIANTHAYNVGIQGVIDGLSDQGFADRIQRVDMEAIRVQDLADAGMSSAKLAQVNNDADAYVDWFNGINETNPGLNANGTNTAVMLGDADRDWLHPTALGYEVMGLTWFNALNDAGLLGDPTPTPDPDPDPTPIGDIPELAGYTIETTGDFNGDGELDALYRRDGAAQTSVRLFSNGQLMSSARGWAMDPTWTVTGSADHDGDGRDDIYWQQNGQDHAWLMNGNTIRNMITVAGPPSGDPTPAPDPTPDPDPTPTGDIPELAGYTIEITGDFNGDGQLDALYRRDGAAQTSIRLFDGNGNRIDAGRGWAMDPTWTVTGSADHDGDGNDDIFWQQNGQNHVWLLNGTTIRNMVAVDAPPSGQPTPNPDPTPDPDPDPTPIGEIPELAGYTIETTGDFNGDGELDALYRRDGAAQTSVRLFSNGQLMSSDRGWAMDPTWTVTGSADHDGDGRDDIYWQQNGQDHAWLMNGNTIRNMITVAGPPSGDPTPTPDPTPDLDPEPTAPANHTLVATADFDGDGDNDQLFRNGSDSSTMLLEFEDGSAVTLHDLRTVSNNWEIVDVADFDEDGSTDLLWLSNSGSVAFWFMDGPNEDFQRTNPNRVDTSWTYERSEDADGDGDLDLIWNDGGTETAWLLNGTTVMEVTTTFGEPATDPTPDPGPTEPGNGFTLSATGDFDGDGDDDRLYRNVGASATLIWLMQNGQQVQSAQQIAVGSSWTVTGVEDANDDGTEDVLWASTSGKTAVWYMDGTEIELQVNPA